MGKRINNLPAIVTMCFIFAMISFVTNMAAPFGNIWKTNFSWAAMMGNMMNFAAYLFMGIPAGKMLVKCGYKKTTLIALATGLTGVCIEYLSSLSALTTIAIYVYLTGAFVCGFCVCMLNTVVNPMLNILGGGGNRGNQYIQIGGTMNSLSATLTPLLVGILIGTVSENTAMKDVVPLLFIAMGAFALAFLIIFFVDIPEPARERRTKKYEHSAWKFRHCVLGTVAIFFYVGVEIGIPAELNFYLSDPGAGGAGFKSGGAVIGGAVVAIYWLLMMAGRFIGTFISQKISTRTQMTFVCTVALLLVVAAIMLPKDMMVRMPGYNSADGFSMFNVPLSALLLVLSGLCTSIMWGCIFNLSVEGLGKYTEQASGIFMMMCVGGGVMPLIQEFIAQKAGYFNSYWLIVAMLVYLLWYAISGSINVNGDIPVE